MFEKGFGEDMQKCLLKYGSLFLLILLTTGSIYVASGDTKAQTTSMYVYLLAIIFPFLFVYYYALLDKAPSSIGAIFSTVFFAVTIFTIIYFYSSLAHESTQIIVFMMNILVLLILAVALSVFAYIYSNYLRSLSGWTGFFANFVFYIPCLILEFFMYIRKEFSMTTNIVFILFVIEILMILAYMYLPYLFSIAMQQNSIPLLKKSDWLDIEQTIATADQLRNLNPPEGVIQPSFYQNYGLSMWIYLNDQPLSYSGYSEETEIFNYGNGKPKITYYNNTENKGEKDNMIVYFTNITSVPDSTSINGSTCISNKFEFRMLKQKWNYFVFNYTTTHADLFINGVLVKSFPFINNFPTFSATDTITVGKDNGLNGAICNIQFYKKNLTLPQIVNSYNMSMNKNPPINNL